jgi:hypothetical protein
VAVKDIKQLKARPFRLWDKLADFFPKDARMQYGP